MFILDLLLGDRVCTNHHEDSTKGPRDPSSAAD